MKPRTRLKWDKFLCRLLGHKWRILPAAETQGLEEVEWFERVCLRCAEVEPHFQDELIPNKNFDAWSGSEPPPAWLGEQEGGKDGKRKKKT